MTRTSIVDFPALIERLQGAIALDPMFARAHSLIASMMYATIAEGAIKEASWESTLANADFHARRAHSLDPLLGEPLVTLGLLETLRGH